MSVASNEQKLAGGGAPGLTVVDGGATVLLVGFGGAMGEALGALIVTDCELQSPPSVADAALSTLVEQRRPAAVLVSYDALESLVELRRVTLAHPDTCVVVGVMRL